MSVYDDDYIKIPVRVSKGIQFRIMVNGGYSDIHEFIYLHKDLRHYLVKRNHGYLESDLEHTISFTGPRGFNTVYGVMDHLYKKIKATKLAKKMYPDADEEDGYLIIIKKGLMLE